MTDTELVDWLEGHPCTLRRDPRDDSWIVHGYSTIGRGVDLRSAIRAFREDSRLAKGSGLPCVGEMAGDDAD